jgi:hypothetical protein
VIENSDGKEATMDQRSVAVFAARIISSERTRYASSVLRQIINRDMSHLEATKPIETR